MENKTKSSKQITARLFAPTGLWIAGIGALALLAMLIMKLLIYIGLYIPTNQKIINLVLYVGIGLVIIGPAVYALLDPQRARDFLTGRQARHGSNAVIMLIAFVLILIVVNAIVFQNPVQWDWTEGKQNSLASQTIDALKSLPAQVHAIGFYTTRLSNSTTLDLFKKVQIKSNKFSYEFVDPETNPAKAQQYKITQDGSVVLIMQGHTELLTNPTEQDFTNALVRLMNPGQRAVYFLTGHGERDIQNPADNAYTRARTVLESKNYTVKSLNLLAENKIPDDALAVIINGPTQPISSQEMSLLKSYVDKGKALVFMEDAILSPDNGKSADPMLDYLTTTWGITINNDLVVDPNSARINYAIANGYGSHPITDKLQSQNLGSFYPNARSLTLTGSVKDVTDTALVTTISTAWGETDFTALQNNQVSFDPNADHKGPLTLAGAGENSTSKGRVVVIGDASFASDLFFDQYGNGTLFINAVDWAAGQGNTINITALQPVDRQMRIMSGFTVLILALVFVILIPGLIIVAGVTTWIQRRKRG